MTVRNRTKTLRSAVIIVSSVGITLLSAVIGAKAQNAGQTSGMHEEESAQPNSDLGANPEGASSSDGSGDISDAGSGADASSADETDSNSCSPVDEGGLAQPSEDQPQDPASDGAQQAAQPAASASTPQAPPVNTTFRSNITVGGKPTPCWFMIIDANKHYVQIGRGTGVDDQAIGNTVTGNLILPNTVSYSGITYTVTALGKWSFCRCSISSTGLDKNTSASHYIGRRTASVKT